MHKNIGQRSRKGRSPRSGSVNIDKCPAVVEAAAQTFSLTAGVLAFLCGGYLKARRHFACSSRIEDHMAAFTLHTPENRTMASQH